MTQKIWTLWMKLSLWYYEWYSSTIIKLGRQFLNRFQFTYSKILLRILPNKIRCWFQWIIRYIIIAAERFRNELYIIKLQSFVFSNQINLINQRLDLILTDGLLIDNLQKKMYNSWSRKFLISSVYLFNDRWFFESISKTALNQLLFPTRNFFFVDGFSIFSAVQPILFGFFFTFVFLNLLTMFICIL